MFRLAANHCSPRIPGLSFYAYQLKPEPSSSLLVLDKLDSSYYKHIDPVYREIDHITIHDGSLAYSGTVPSMITLLRQSRVIEYQPT